MNRRKLILIFIIGVIAFVILGIKYWSIPINNVYSCQSFIYDDKNSEQIEVNIEGRYMKSLFRKDYMTINIKTGDIEYPSIEHIVFPFKYRGIITSSISHKDYLFPHSKTIGGYVEKTHLKNVKMIILEYAHFVKGKETYPHEIAGSIIFSKDMSQIVFFPSYPDTIIASGRNRSEAEETWHHLVERD